MKNLFVAVWLLTGSAALAQTMPSDSAVWPVYHPTGEVQWRVAPFADSLMRGFQGRFGRYAATLLPFVGRPALLPADYAVPLRPDTAGNQAYRAFDLLKGRLHTELTATTQVLLLRCAFPLNREQGHLLLDLGSADSVWATCYRINAGEWAGQLVAAGAADTAYFALRFSWPCHNARLLDMSLQPPTTEVRVTGRAIIGLFDFFMQSEPLIVALAYSARSPEHARSLLLSQYNNLQFNAVSAAARQAWAVWRTPLLPAADQSPGVPDAPVLAQGAPVFKKNTAVALSCADTAAAIFYTLDGSVPSAQSMRYTKPFTLKKNTPLRAIALRDGQASTVLAVDFIRKKR